MKHNDEGPLAWSLQGVLGNVASLPEGPPVAPPGPRRGPGPSPDEVGMRAGDGDRLGAGADDLRDRAEILDVLAAFCERIDEYDIAGLAEVFTEDCFTDYGPGRGGPVSGLADVQARIARGQAEFRRTHHQLGQSRIRVNGNEARATTYVTASHEHRDGGRSRVHLRYLDRLRRTGEGWRIAERRVHAAVVVGMDGVDWVWVPRAEPAP